MEAVLGWYEPAPAESFCNNASWMARAAALGPVASPAHPSGHPTRATKMAGPGRVRKRPNALLTPHPRLGGRVSNTTSSSLLAGIARWGRPGLGVHYTHAANAHGCCEASVAATGYMPLYTWNAYPSPCPCPNVLTLARA